MALELVKDTGVRYTDEQRAIIFWAWSTKCGRNAAETARWVTEHSEQYELPPSINRRTITEWVNQHGWHQQADLELFDVAPHQRFLAQVEVNQGQLDALRLLRQAITASPELETDLWVDDYETTEDGKVIKIKTKVRGIDWKAVQVRIMAAKEIVGMAGLTPVGVRDVGNVSHPPVITEVDDAVLTAETEEELKRLELEARAKSTRDAGGRHAARNR